MIPELSVENLSNKELNIVVTPNPSSSYFSLFIKGNRKEPVRIKVINIVGHTIEKYQKLPGNTNLQLGYNWESGSYFVEILQGNQRKIIKIIKAN